MILWRDSIQIGLSLQMSQQEKQNTREYPQSIILDQVYRVILLKESQVVFLKHLLDFRQNAACTYMSYKW